MTTTWNGAYLGSFLVENIFLTKHVGQDPTFIKLGWTAFQKSCNKNDFMTRAKGLKRIEHQIDIVKMIRKFFVLDVMKEHIIPTEKLALIRQKGQFVIEPD